MNFKGFSIGRLGWLKAIFLYSYSAGGDSGSCLDSLLLLAMVYVSFAQAPKSIIRQRLEQNGR